MNYPYIAESKRINDKDAFEKAYYFIEKRFNESNLENYSYLLMNQFFKDCNGRASGIDGFENDEHHLSLQARINRKLNGSFILFDGKNEGYQSTKLSYFYDRIIETPYVLVARNSFGIHDKAIGSIDPSLDTRIRNIYRALKQRRYDKEVENE